MSGSPTRVLVVDDNVELAENLAEILESEGYVVVAHGDPEGVLARIEEMDFDVALLDVKMPGMDGVTLHERLAQLRPCAQFFLMSGFVSQARTRSARDSGILDILPKPLPIERLLARLPPSDHTSETEVLLVNDDPSLCPSLVRELNAHGYRARCARSLADARRAVALHRPDIVVAHSVLSDGDGIQLVREVISSDEVPVIFLTAASESESAVARFAGPGRRVLRRPFTTDQLLALLEEVSG